MKRGLPLATAGIIIVIAVRIALEPEEQALPFRGFNPVDLERAQAVLSQPLMDVTALATLAQPRRVLLVGETHFVMEPQRYMTALLEELRDTSLILLMELSQDCQEQIDSYMEGGDGRNLAPIWKEGKRERICRLNSFCIGHTKTSPRSGRLSRSMRTLCGSSSIASS